MITWSNLSGHDITQDQHHPAIWQISLLQLHGSAAFWLALLPKAPQMHLYVAILTWNCPAVRLWSTSWNRSPRWTQGLYLSTIPCKNRCLRTADSCRTWQLLHRLQGHRTLLPEPACWAATRINSLTPFNVPWTKTVPEVHPVSVHFSTIIGWKPWLSNMFRCIMICYSIVEMKKIREKNRKSDHSSGNQNFQH